MLTQQPAWSLVRKQHENFKYSHNARSDECDLPILDSSVSITSLILNAKKVGNEDTNGDEKLVAVSKETLPSC